MMPVTNYYSPHFYMWSTTKLRLYAYPHRIRKNMQCFLPMKGDLRASVRVYIIVIVEESLIYRTDRSFMDLKYFNASFHSEQS